MSFARLLSEATIGALPRTGDVLAVGLPLLRQIEDLHRDGLVTGASGVSAVDYDGQRVQVRSSQRIDEQANIAAIDAVTSTASRAPIAVADRLTADATGRGPHTHITSYDVIDPDDPRPERPVWVRGYRVWEQLHGHHDHRTDVAMAGLWLCSYAFGLDLSSHDGMDALVRQHRHPNRLNPDLHPVVAAALIEMVQPDRSQRSSDIAHIIARLEHHRDIPVDLDLSAAYDAARSGRTDWRQAVLATLRDRVFDTTRRNRELYFRPTSTSVNLTEASVPLMLDIDRIRPDDLLTWTEPANTPLRNGEVDLAKWCRFEEAPYLGPALDKLISDQRRTKMETGHGRLKLVIAFLHWYDPTARESVTSPLLTMPATLTRKKGVTTRYRLGLPHEEADVNPVLRHVFAGRFGIDLPESVEPSHDGIAALVTELDRKVKATSPSLSIEIIDKPRVSLLRRKAQLRVDNYRRHRARTLATSGRWRRQDHSYELDDWRPLGRALYERFVRPDELPLRELAGASVRPRYNNLGAETAAPGERTVETYSLTGADVSVDRWQVDLCSVTLTMLGSRRTSLARDYDAVLAGDSVDVRATPFETIFQPEPADRRAGSTLPFDPQQHLVLPADDAQARAVQRAVRGDSFIIQGPPGTGKSQTITNVIAALAAEGKRVLFVCEKRAAIDVVAHRLSQVGLKELSALIHDSQLDRKEFIYDLGATYRSWLAARPADRNQPSLSARRRREELLAEVESALRPVREMAAELHRDLGGGVDVGTAIQRLVALEAGTGNVDRELDVSLDEWTRVRPGLDLVADACASAGLRGPLGAFAALRVSPGALGGDSIAICRSLGAEIVDASKELDASLTVGNVRDGCRWIPSLRAVAEAGALGALDPRSPRHVDLRSAADRLSERLADVEQTADVLDRWANPPNAEDTAAALAVAQNREGSFFKFLRSDWKQVKTLVEGNYRFDAHQVTPTIAAVLSDLNEHHARVAELAAARAASVVSFGTGDAIAMRDFVDTSHEHPAFAALVAGADFDRTAAGFERFETATAMLLVGDDATVGELASMGERLAGTPVSNEVPLLRWASLAEGGTRSATLDNAAVLTAVLDAEVSIDACEAVILRRELDRWQHAVDTTGFSGPSIDEFIARAGSLYPELLAANAAVIVEQAMAVFHENVAFSEESMAGRTTEDKDRKRAYKAARRVVEREAEKKMRHRSIREMVGGESGPVVGDLRPIWMMSPLSVSDTLPLTAGLFDVVIFDEASQIPVEDALPSVFRAPQVIVVGDEMQMPPTRFFSSDDGEDAEVVVDDDGHRLSIALDGDSFLTQAARALDSSLLNWHYRSRYESLIAYSNHAFYSGRLATIPDTVLGSATLPEIVASTADDGAENASATLQRPISFHFLDHGEYRDRRNVAEADYIAEMLRSILRAGTGLTVGIVAFSEAQQSAIESALDDLAAIDRDFAARYEAEVNRVEDGEFVGLFVKNLENVQGDERDLIIMSVCYGPDPGGRIRMNFGPINNAGGERRLNVIFSRAKHHMAVVASLRGEQITNTNNEGAAHLAGFLRYAEAESVGDADAAAAQLRAMSNDSEVAAEVGSAATALAVRLRERGCEAHVAVGRSSFQVDVAVAVDGCYRVGVLFEPGSDANERAADRYISEAGVLQAFGWRILRVPLSDWLTDPDRTVDRVAAAVQMSPRFNRRPG